MKSANPALPILTSLPLLCAALSAQAKYTAGHYRSLIGTPQTTTESPLIARSLGGFRSPFSMLYDSWAVSSPAALEGEITMTYISLGTPIPCHAIAEWEFDDVVFLDGGTSAQPVSVAFNFLAEGTTTTTPGVAPLRMTIGAAFASNGGGAGSWAGNLQFDTTPVLNSSGTFNLLTNTPYRFTIQADTGTNAGGGTNVTTTRSVVTFDSVPFTLPPGITAQSTQANIHNNVWNPPTLQIAPRLTATNPALSTADLDVLFSEGEPGSLGFFLFGAPSTGVASPILDWFALELPLSGLISSSFLADANGEATFTIPLYPALSGFQLGIQAAQLATNPLEVYGTNAWLAGIQ